MHRPLAAPALALAFLLAACDSDPVAWRDPAAAGTIADAVLSLDATGAPSLARAASAPAYPLPAEACAGSLRLAHARGGEWHAAWWQPRADGSAALMSARSDDGGATWRAPVVADGRDAGTDGCVRPAPSIAADSVSGYVHIVYYQRPPEGAGVWYTHSMDGGDSFHSTVGLVYGDEASRASVASDGMILVAAYETPHSRPRRIGVALSTDGGHTFRRPLRASEGDIAAGDPRVAVHGRDFAVSWEERLAQRHDSAVVRSVVRAGRVVP
ncbi:MAG TPA: sialidase family protein [Gemmatimonadaceae bacterium]|nr:sialidase family protein [Gemmatimonadaceae bacterium]